MYSTRVVDNSMLIALNTIAQTQSNHTLHTAKLCNDLLDYCSAYPNVGDMMLQIYSDASYLVAPCAKSRVAGYFQLTSHSSTPSHNAPIFIECKTLKHVVTSSAICETAAAFHNAQRPIPICHMQHKLGYPQPPTPITLDNCATTIFIKNYITQKNQNHGI